jgi:ZIP family zinc transporter
LAAGVVFSVAAVEILPEIRRLHQPAEVIVGFSAGIIVMLSLRSLTSRFEGKNSAEARSLPVPMLTAIGIDVLIDGFLIGFGLRAGQRQGLLLSVALAAEFLSLGLAMTLELLERGLGPSTGC